MSSLIALLFGALKIAGMSKILFSVGSLLLSIYTYSLTYGWEYAAGFVGLILIHEMGHYIASLQKGLKVGLPTFIPFVGAWIDLKEHPQDAETEAYIAYAGPFIGSIASFIVYFIGRYIDSDLCLALANAGFIINMFNLIPLSPLDGGRITAVISPLIWLIGIPLLISLWVLKPNIVLIFVAILAIPNVIKAWKDRHSMHSYYNAPLSVRCEYAIMYIGLIAVLGLMINNV